MIRSSGYVDLQCNGGYGIDLSVEPERVWELAARLPSHGVTAWCPTLPTAPSDRYERLMTAVSAGPPNDGVDRAHVIGIHFEGPMLNPARRGAHSRHLLREPSLDIIANWSSDVVSIVTLAPELEGAAEVARELRRRGIVVSAGHSEATSAHASEVDSVTHLFNAMSGFGHRDEGMVGAALDGSFGVAGLIADEIHVAAHAVRLAWRTLGPDRIFLVTDAVSAMGLRAPNDPPRLSDGTLAGSSITMDQAVRNLVAMTGCSFEAAVNAASTTPASLVNWQPDPDDLLLLDAGLHIIDCRVGATARR